MMENPDEILDTNIADAIDPKVESQILASGAFVNVDGAFNLRDLSNASPLSIKPGYAFRSGPLEQLTEAG